MNVLPSVIFLTHLSMTICPLYDLAYDIKFKFGVATGVFPITMNNIRIRPEKRSKLETSIIILGA